MNPAWTAPGDVLYDRAFSSVRRARPIAALINPGREVPCLWRWSPDRAVTAPWRWLSPPEPPARRAAA